MSVRKPLPKKVTIPGVTAPAPPEPPPKPFARWNLLGTRDLAKPLPPVPWLCEPLRVAPGMVTLFAGYGYSRKTLALQSLGLSVASGRPVWGLWSCRRGRVVHLDYEQGQYLDQERYQRIARGMGFELGELPDDALTVACLPHVYLDEHNVFEELVRLVDGAALVIVDSLRAAFPKADENSSEVRAYLDMLSRVSERTGACFVVIHHARKPSPMQGGGVTHAIRGSAALFDACQTVYVFEGEKDTPTTCHHQKDRLRGKTLDSFGLTSEDVPGNGLRVIHLDAEQLAAQATAKEDAIEEAGLERTAERIIEKLADHGALAEHGFHGTRRDVAALVKAKKVRFDAAFTKLVGEGILFQASNNPRSPIWKLR